MIIFTIIGIIVVVLFIFSNIIYINNEDLLQLSFYDFGFIIARNETLIKNMNKLRKTENNTFFITAPKWFNVYIYNIGGVK